MSHSGMPLCRSLKYMPGLNINKTNIRRWQLPQAELASAKDNAATGPESAIAVDVAACFFQLVARACMISLCGVPGAHSRF